MTAKKSKLELSIVIPVLNEEECIAGLVEEIHHLWETGGLPRSTEVIFVDDGSTDGTRQEIQTARKTYSALLIRLLSHNRTFGQT